MSLAAFLQQYVKPSRWWRRRKTVQVTIWPRFLAQALCPHARKQAIMWDVEAKTKTGMCLDCHKHILERNDCAHGEVQVSVWETANGQSELVPRAYRCEHCGVGLEAKDLPPGARVAHANIGDR
jgi:hypothetical protein